MIHCVFFSLLKSYISLFRCGVPCLSMRQQFESSISTEDIEYSTLITDKLESTNSSKMSIRLPLESRNVFPSIVLKAIAYRNPFPIFYSVIIFPKLELLGHNQMIFC